MRACASGGEKSPRPPGGSDAHRPLVLHPHRERAHAVHASRPPWGHVVGRTLQSRPTSASARHPNSRILIAPLPSPRTISLFFPVARFCKDLCKESNGMVEFSGFFFPRFLSFSKNTFFNRRKIGQFQFGKEKFVLDRNEKVEFHDRQISSVETERKAGGSCRMEFGSDVGGKWFLVAVANGAALPYSSGSLNGPVLVRK